MIIRFKVAFDNGSIRCKAGETTGEVPDALASRLVRSGLAEAIPGNRGVNAARASAGMAPVRKRTAKRKS